MLFARAVGVTHSAASQTAAQMARAGVIVFLFPAFTGYRARGIGAMNPAALPGSTAEAANPSSPPSVVTVTSAAGSGGAKGKP